MADAQSGDGTAQSGGDGWNPKRVQGKGLEADAAKRWLACPVCGNETGNVTYNSRDFADPMNPALVRHCDCGECGHRWPLGKPQQQAAPRKATRTGRVEGGYRVNQVQTFAPGERLGEAPRRQ